MNNNILEFTPILIAIISLLLFINTAFALTNPYTEKNNPFECGFLSFLWQNRVQFSISFFLFALLFLLFDLEVLLVYPYFVSGYNNGIYGLVVMLLFLILLVIGFGFELAQNALTITSKQLKLIYLDKDKDNKDSYINYINSSICYEFNYIFYIYYIFTSIKTQLNASILLLTKISNFLLLSNNSDSDNNDESELPDAPNFNNESNINADQDENLGATNNSDNMSDNSNNDPNDNNDPENDPDENDGSDNGQDAEIDEETLNTTFPDGTRMRDLVEKGQNPEYLDNIHGKLSVNDTHYAAEVVEYQDNLENANKAYQKNEATIRECRDIINSRWNPSDPSKHDQKTAEAALDIIDRATEANIHGMNKWDLETSSTDNFFASTEPHNIGKNTHVKYVNESKDKDVGEKINKDGNKDNKDKDINKDIDMETGKPEVNADIVNSNEKNSSNNNSSQNSKPGIDTDVTGSPTESTAGGQDKDVTSKNMISERINNDISNTHTQYDFTEATKYKFSDIDPILEHLNNFSPEDLSVLMLALFMLLIFFIPKNNK